MAIKSKYSVSRGGYFGFQLVNKTNNYEQKVYIRPYAVYNGTMVLGYPEEIDFSGSGNIEGLTPMDTWLSKNRLNDAGVVKYTY